jgi:hypothetical protein
MNTRTQVYPLIAAILAILVGTWFVVRAQEPPVPSFAGTVRRDCAPWDGAAFTVSIPIEKSVLDISIYQSPDIRYGRAFLFPDKTMREGHALLLAPVGIPEQLAGRVWFEGVDRQKSVEGRFKLASEKGERFEGRFVAVWENEPIYCG